MQPRTARTMAFIGAALIVLGSAAILLDQRWGILPLSAGFSLGAIALTAIYFATAPRARDDEPSPPTTRR